jgi:hypothetical protein
METGQGWRRGDRPTEIGACLTRSGLQSLHAEQQLVDTIMLIDGDTRGREDHGVIARVCVLERRTGHLDLPPAVKLRITHRMDGCQVINGFEETFVSVTVAMFSNALFVPVYGPFLNVL